MDESPRKWTKEELDRLVEMPDGSRVPFGDMTVEQHQAMAARAELESAKAQLRFLKNQEAAAEYVDKLKATGELGD